MIIIANIHHTVTVCQAPSVNYLNYSYNPMSGGNITPILQRSKFGSSLFGSRHLTKVTGLVTIRISVKMKT